MNGEPALSVIAAVAIIVGVATVVVMRGHARGPVPAQPPETRAAASAFVSGVVLTAVALLLVVLLNSAYTTWAVHNAQSQSAAVAAASQQRGQAIFRKLCLTIDRLAALQPPPGNPGTNPSRAYLQDQHSVLAQLGKDIGCS